MLISLPAFVHCESQVIELEVLPISNIRNLMDTSKFFTITITVIEEH
jgi:hypothetical protein